MSEITFPPDVKARLSDAASAAGFYPPYGLSAYIKHLVVEGSGVGSKGAAPVLVRFTSAEQRQTLDDYRTVKGFASLEAFILYAAESYAKRVVLTGAENYRIARIVAERQKSAQR